SECFVFARRAVGRALATQAPATGEPSATEIGALAAHEPPAASEETREALWRDAGILRRPEALSRLLESPHPLSRLIARCALAREESRGAHLRIDFPD